MNFSTIIFHKDAAHQLDIISIAADAGGLCALNLGIVSQLFLKQSYSDDYQPVDSTIVKGVMDFFQKGIPYTASPLNLQGTPFQKKVWNSLLTIPYGQTLSYKKLASLIGKPKAYRAVANALNKNPIPFIIPCHRVIKNDGQVGGFYFKNNLKTYLLDKEINNKPFYP